MRTGGDDVDREGMMAREGGDFDAKKRGSLGNEEAKVVVDSRSRHSLEVWVGMRSKVLRKDLPVSALKRREVEVEGTGSVPYVSWKDGRVITKGQSDWR